MASCHNYPNQDFTVLSLKPIDLMKCVPNLNENLSQYDCRKFRELSQYKTSDMHTHVLLEDINGLPASIFSSNM